MADSDRSRGVLTDNDRRILQEDHSDKSRAEKQPLYNVRAAVRERVPEVLKDLRLLQHRQPELAGEIAPLLDGVQWADPDTTYAGDGDVDKHEVLINGETPLPPRTDIAEPSLKGRFQWGTGGAAGEKQLAVALLAHATDPGIAREYHNEFHWICTKSLADQWELTADRIQTWVRKLESGEGDIDLERLKRNPYEAKKNELVAWFDDQIGRSETDLSDEQREMIADATEEVMDSLDSLPGEQQ